MPIYCGWMLTNRSAPHARVTPVLIVADVRAAVAWYADVFGFVEHVRIGKGTVRNSGCLAGSRPSSWWEVASAQQVDRSTIMRIKQVAKEGALSALAASKPGVKARQRDYELEAARAEIARFSEACKELAVKLTMVEGKGGWG